MKLEYDNLADAVSDITKKVIEYILNMQKKRIKLVAICKSSKSEDENLARLYQDKREIVLGSDFQTLSTRDKLLVIKSTIHTHYQMNEGYIFGEIAAYELNLYNDLGERNILFSFDGTLLEETMEQYL